MLPLPALTPEKREDGVHYLGGPLILGQVAGLFYHFYTGVWQQILEGVGVFDILINEGKVNLKWEGEKPFGFGSVNQAVEKAGYTLRSAKANFVGSVAKIGDRFVLVSDAGHEERYSLYDPARIDPKSKAAHKHEGAVRALGEERVRQLEGIIGRKDIVRIFGAVHGHKGKGVLPALGIERLEVLSQELKK